MHTQATSILFAYVEEVEVYRTLDAGVSWENVLFIPQMGPLALKPDSGDVLLAVVDGGLMRSIDTGDNWQQILTGYFTSVAYRPGPQYPIYTAIRDSVRVSADDGLTWEEPGIGLPEDVLISSIATHPVSDSVAYLSNFDGQLFTTIDGGGSWQDIAMDEEFSVGADIFVINHNDPKHMYICGYNPGVPCAYSTIDENQWEDMLLFNGRKPGFSDIVVPKINPEIL